MEHPRDHIGLDEGFGVNRVPGEGVLPSWTNVCGPPHKLPLDDGGPNRSEEARGSQQAFETLLREILMRFAGTIPDEIGVAVRAALQEIAGFCGVGDAFARILERERLEDTQATGRSIQASPGVQHRQSPHMRGESAMEYNCRAIVGESKAIKEVLAQAEQVARTHASVLLLGETGVGKELIAQAIHDMSACAGRPMVKVNCAGLPSTLVESELFGREKGAYTGALTKQAGRFETADGSTILLDEIGELPLELQAKLLRVLHDGRFERLGSTKTIHVNVRVIAATSRNLSAAIREGRFRQDLYYRLAVFPITTPPLRERREDIPALVWAFIKEFESKGRPMIASVPPKTMEALQHYAWPGNIRELRNVIEHAMIISSGPVLRVELPKSPDAFAMPTRTLEEVERSYILHVLEQAGWLIRGDHGAAATLGLKPTTLQSKMERLGIRRPKPNGVS